MTSEPAILRVVGRVARQLELGRSDLAAFDDSAQLTDVRTLGAKRPGRAVRLSAVLDRAGVASDARYLTLHASADDFHASLPLAAVRDRAWLIYADADGGPLPSAAGGPLRFFVPDPAACQTAEVDECASVKFVDTIQLSTTRGQDNRPTDEAAHRALHDQASHNDASADRAP